MYLDRESCLKAIDIIDIGDDIENRAWQKRELMNKGIKQYRYLFSRNNCTWNN